MDDAARRAKWRGLGTGFLLGLLAAGIPFVLFLLRPPPAIVVQVPGPTAAAGSGERVVAPGGAAPERGSKRSPKVEESRRGEPGVAGESPEGESGKGDPKEGEAAPGDAPAESKESAWERERRIREALTDDLQVRVSDAETGAPMGGVSITVFLGTFHGGGWSTWRRTKADGSAEFGPRRLLEGLRARRGPGGDDYFPIGSATDPFRADVRIRVPGFRPFLAPATGSKLDARMEKEGSPRAFGSLAGRVLGPDGASWPKPVEVSLQDPVVLDSFTTWVVPDPDGRFLLTGLPAGPWGAKINDGWGTRARVEIAPGGTAEVELKVPDDEDSRADGLPERRRPVTVTLPGRDLPFGGAILLDGDWGSPLRAEVSGGRAVFAAVPPGAVRVTLRRPDGTDESSTAVVPEGEGDLEIPFPTPM